MSVGDAALVSCNDLEEDHMRNKMKLVLVCTLVVFGALQLRAQTTVTNIVQDLDIKLTAYYQKESTTNSGTIMRNAGKASISNKDIISLLGLQLNVLFSSDAKLLLISNLEDALNPKVVVRDTVGGNNVDTEVGQYFSAVVHSSVENSKIKLNPLNVSGTGYDVVEFNMAVDTAVFSVQGFAQTSISTVKYQGQVVGEVHTGSMNVSGSGTYGAAPGGGLTPVAIKGTVKVSGKNTEVETQG
jgi:hypothetical protein